MFTFRKIIFKKNGLRRDIVLTTPREQTKRRRIFF